MDLPSTGSAAVPRSWARRSADRGARAAGGRGPAPRPEDVPPAQERRPADTPSPPGGVLPPPTPHEIYTRPLPVAPRTDRIAFVLPCAHVGAVRTQHRPGSDRAATAERRRRTSSRGEAAAPRKMPPKGDGDDFVPKKKEGECVKVVVRVRPLSRKEIQDGHDEATKADEDSGRISAF